MARSYPSKPGWYRDPGQLRALRYWDGERWTDRERPRPSWYLGTDRFEVDQEMDRSSEGPAQPHELREPVASGAWSREWLPWRLHQPDPTWPRPLGRALPRSWHPPRTAPQVKLGPARRPLLAMVSLLVVAVAVVVSSVAFITPYEVKRPSPITLQPAQDPTLKLANKACASVVPSVRHVFEASSGPRALTRAAASLDALSRQMWALSWRVDQLGRAQEWLSTLAELSADQRTYAMRLASAPTGSALTAQAVQARDRAWADAARADRFSANLLLGPSCTFGLRTAA